MTSLHRNASVPSAQSGHGPSPHDSTNGSPTSAPHSSPPPIFQAVQRPVPDTDTQSQFMVDQRELPPVDQRVLPPVDQRVLPPDMRPAVKEDQVGTTSTRRDDAAVPSAVPYVMTNVDDRQASAQPSTDGDFPTDVGMNERPPMFNNVDTGSDVRGPVNDQSGNINNNEMTDRTSDADQSNDVSNNERSSDSSLDDARENRADVAHANDMSYRSSESAIEENQHADVIGNGFSDNYDDNDSNRLPFSRVVADVASDGSNPNQPEYGEPRQEYVTRDKDSRIPDRDTHEPIDSAIVRPLSPNEDSYKAAGGVDEVATASAGHAGSERDEADVFSNVAQKDRETLQHLAFNMDMFGHNTRGDVEPEHLKEEQQRPLADDDDDAEPRGRDMNEARTKSESDEQSKSEGPDEGSRTSDQEDVDATDGDDRSARRGFSHGRFLCLC